MYIYDLYEAILEESKSEQRAVKSSLRILLTHLLKLKYQNDYAGKNSWIESIQNSYFNLKDQFKGIGKGALYNNFYLKKLDFDSIYKDAKKIAVLETRLAPETFPDKCEWSKEELVDIDFIYDFINKYK